MTNPKAPAQPTGPDAPATAAGRDAVAASGRSQRQHDRQSRPAASPAAPQSFLATPEKVRQAQQSLLQEAEPSGDDLRDEEGMMAAERQRAAKKKRQSEAAGVDLLASYMGQLGQIPLFSPEQELAHAAELERLERALWAAILAHPRAAMHLGRQQAGLQPELIADLEHLNTSYRRAAARAFSRALPPAQVRTLLIDRLAAGLRFADFDKDLLEQLMARLRREVWERRVLTPHAAYRLTHADLTAIERARGSALRARNDFVRANLRLVVSVARKFNHYKIAFIDLIQEGNVGLMKAVHRFDHRRGFRFSTYAHWWIRQNIERAIMNKGSQVRLPVHVIDSRRQVGRATSKLTHSLGRTPTSGEIGHSLNIAAAKVEQIQRGINQDPISLDDPVGSHDPRKFLDMVHDSEAPAVDEALIRENTHAHVRALLHLLNPIEKDIIRRRFGLGQDSDQTLDEIGQIYNLSRERVRQIQAQGLMKMRRMCERRRIS